MRGEEKEAVSSPKGNEDVSCADSGSVLGSISTDISPASTVLKSTRTSSGSTLLTSMSLVLTSESSPPFLRGVVEVLGRPPSDFFVGEPGTVVKPAICFVRDLDLVDMAALYHVAVEDSKLDVEVRKSQMAALRV